MIKSSENEKEAMTWLLQIELVKEIERVVKADYR